MGAGTSAEEFFLKSVNVESIFEFIERTDYLFLYSIKECQTVMKEYIFQKWQNT